MDDFGRIQVGAVAVAPSNPNRVYAGSGCGDSSTWVQNYDGLGLLVSDDGGVTWRVTASGATVVGGAFYELDVDPANPDVVVAATTSGLFVSENGGDTWTPTLPDKGSACSLSRCRSAPQRLFAATLTGANVPGLWTSADGGRSWSPLPTTGLKSTASKRGRAEIAVDPASPDTVWAGGFDLWRSTDAGLTFQRLSDWNYPPDPSNPPTLPFVHADKHAVGSARTEFRTSRRTGGSSRRPTGGRASSSSGRSRTT